MLETLPTENVISSCQPQVSDKGLMSEKDEVIDGSGTNSQDTCAKK